MTGKHLSQVNRRRSHRIGGFGCLVAAGLAFLRVTGGAGLYADPIPGLYNTGVDDSSQLLPTGAVDPHYELIQSADGGAAGPEAFVVGTGFPIPPWLDHGPESKWIAPQSNQSSGNAAGDYVYQLTFDLAGFQADTAVITGRWSSDNAGVGIRINGIETGISYSGDFSVFSSTFTIDSGFRDGLNTLEFIVNNAGSSVNPTGFRAELSGTVDPGAGPGTAPSITVPPESLEVAFKDAASLGVSVFGSEPLFYQWRLDGSPVPGADGRFLTIPFVTAEHAGSYDVRVWNAYGQTVSSAAVLEVTYPSSAEREYEPLGPSTRRTGITFSEIHYAPRPRDDGRRLEFIELYNSNPFFEDLGGWRLEGDITFEFPNGTRIPGNSFIVVAAVPADIHAVYGYAGAMGGWAGVLPDDGGTIRLRKRSGALLLEVDYRSAAPWPVAAAGMGHTLVLARPSYGENDPRSWAASAWKGGSPGESDPLPDGPLEQVCINELLIRPEGAEQQPFVELFNHGGQPVDLSGCGIQVGDLPGDMAEALLPAGVMLAPGERRAFTAADLQLAFPQAGGVLLLSNPQGSRVIDAIRFGPQARGRSHGRFPDGSERWMELLDPGPGLRNTNGYVRPVVINEIMYHPPDGRDDLEYVELFNRGATAIDLSGWAFVDGIEFVFPAGTSLSPGGYLVVARNRTRLLVQYPDLAPADVIGDFAGSLANGGERLALAFPEELDPGAAQQGGGGTDRVYVIADEVTYSDGEGWGTWADGGGSSLELVDSNSDNGLAQNWADSDESDEAEWTLVEHTGRLDHPHPSSQAADQLQIMLLGAGEVIIDDVAVSESGSNRIANGSFHSDTSGWLLQGTHSGSHWNKDEGFSRRGSLDLVAGERGDHVANCARTDLRPTIPNNTDGTIRARVRWLRGHPEILFRLRGGALEVAARLEITPTPGTPGRANSRAAANHGPAITGVIHRPILPKPTDAIRVFATVQDPDGMESVNLHYRIDPNGADNVAPMVDDGSGPDETGGDGVFTGLIPRQSAGRLIAFHVEAADQGQPAVTTFFPAESPDRECLVRLGDRSAGNDFGTYRFWLTQSVLDTWAAREKMSNEALPVTFVYNDHRVIYGSGGRYSGSSYTSPGYNSPTGNLCGYDLFFPKDDPFLGDNRVILDWPIRDSTAQREPLMYWMLEQYGLPNNYRRYVYLFVNGLRRGSIYEDVQQPGSDTIEEWFGNNGDGHLYKTDCWNEFDNAGYRIDPCVLNTLQIFTTTDGEKKVSRYRWNWRPRAAGDSANDFQPLFDLIDLVNDRQAPTIVLTGLVDIDHWMRTFAMNDLASYWDGFGNPNAKNTFIFKPLTDRWKLMCWDFDVGLGVFNDPPNAALFDVNDPTIARMYQNPELVRFYWAALQEALDGFFKVGAGTEINDILDARYEAFRADGLTLGDPGSITSWITQRRGYLLGQLGSVQESLAILTNGGNDFTANQSVLQLTGTAPVQTYSLRINGVAFPVSWHSVTTWRARLPLLSGSNLFEIEAFDRYGQRIAGEPQRIRVQYDGVEMPVPSLVINEWMAQNNGSFLDPSDGGADDWFEIYNAGDTSVALDGFRLTDDLDDPDRYVIPAGFELPPGGFLLVWADGDTERSGMLGELHVNFQLRREGEQIALFDSIGRLVDLVAFGSQPADMSRGRWPDGAPEPMFQQYPSTPGGPNMIHSGSIPPIVIDHFVLTDPDTLRLRWNSLPGRRYLVEFKETLDQDEWWPVGEPLLAEGLGMEVLLPISAEAYQGIFRVVLLNP